MMTTARFSSVFIALAALALAGGCGDDDGGAETVDMDASTGMATASIRVIHLSPNAPEVDVFANAQPSPVVAALGFPQGTGYLEVPSGTYTFDVAAAGATPSDAVLSIEGLALAGDTFYTAVAIDELDSISALALVDDYSGLAEGDIRIRAVHAAPAVGEVDIWNIPAEGDPAPLYENVPFGVAGDALDVPAGAYTLGFDVDDDATPDVIFDVPALEAGTVANVFATNDGAGNVFLIAQLRDGSTVRIDPVE